jgi:hypothetical protein
MARRTYTTNRQLAEFASYLRQCTNDQVIGVYEKERAAHRRTYERLAREEVIRRQIEDRI